MAVDNFEFKMVGAGKFLGYVSASDKTLINPGNLIKGSQNVYKKLSGTIANRPGLKRRGAVDATLAGVVASFVWNNSLGLDLPLRVCNNKLQVESDFITSGTYVWYDLLMTSTLLSPAAALTRFVFDAWWDNDEKKDRLLMARGDSSLLHWSGGMTQILSGTALLAGGVGSFTLVSGGTGYRVNDIVTISGGGGTGAQVRVLAIGAFDVITDFEPVATGSGYADTNAAATTDSGIGTGATFDIVTGSYGTLTKKDTDNWAQAGFASVTDAEKKIVITVNGVITEFTYLFGEDGTTLQGVSGGDPTAIATNAVAIQAVISASNTPATSYNLDFLKVLGNQVLTGSYTSKILYLSADTDFTDFTNSGSLVYGDPDFVIVDSPPSGIGIKDGAFAVSAGEGAWYIITPNSVPPISFTVDGTTRFVITKVDKQPGSGGVAALAHEFIDTRDDDLVYLGRDHQVRIFGIFRNLVNPKYPTISQAIHDELEDEDFTGGHLRCIGDFIHITVPNSGKDYMHQTRESVNAQGNVVAERLWHPPQVRGVSRFEVIDSVTFGHSNSNPQIYQIWNTGQWHDDSPSGDNMPYTSVMLIAYQNYGRRQGLLGYTKIYTEGYMTQGTTLRGYNILDYQGSAGVQDFTVNSIDNSAIFFTNALPPVLGSSSLGGNPLGDGVVVDPNDQETLPKFRKISLVTKVNVFEHTFGLYSEDPDSRWEILALGAAIERPPQQATFLTKSG